jgi:hypothetical protein
MAAPLIMTRFGLATPVSVEPDWALLVAGGVLIGLGVRFGGASLGGVLTGTARRSGPTVAIWGAIVAGAAVAVYLRGLLSGGGVA